MFQLIKWIALGVFGFLVYEVLISTSQRSAVSSIGRRGMAPRRQSTGNITGYSGEGSVVPVVDPDGAERTARVGRGVI